MINIQNGVKYITRKEIILKNICSFHMLYLSFGCSLVDILRFTTNTVQHAQINGMTNITDNIHD